MNQSNNWGDWGPHSFERRGRGGFNRGRGFGRGRGPRGRNNFGGPPPFSDNRGNRGYRGNWSNRQPRQRNEIPKKRLTEADIGVTEYVGDHNGFDAIIKSRYSDFQVSEINEEGEIAQLTDLTAPTPEVETVDEDEYLLLNKYNLEILPMETWDNINKLVMATEEVPDKVEVDVTGMTKDQRTKIHEAVKKAFADTIIGSTVQVDDKKIVRFQKYRKGVRVDTRVKWVWPEEYVYFVLHKENCDTMEATMRLADSLHMSARASQLGYAGTKDRRAKTSQWCSARRLEPARLAAAAAALRNLSVGNYCFRPRPLKLGMLRGNRFRIALRNVSAPDAVVAAACEQLAARGFVNYYGLQRFGTRRAAPTYRLGALLLQENYSQVLDSVLAEEDASTANMCNTIRRSLARARNDFLGALGAVPRNVRLLYLHAYQSLVWNRAATERLRRAGLRAAPGDLVALSRDQDLEIESDDEDSNEKEGTGTEDENADSKKNNEESETQKVDNNKQKEKPPKPKVSVKVLTQEDIDSGKYSIFDIVMPLPGYLVEYPPNMKDYYEELLAKDGLKLDMKHKIKHYCLSGAYRRVVVVPGELQHRVVRHREPRADLILSDADVLNGVPEPVFEDDAPHRSLLLTMSLPSSCYATMALRELLRADTSGYEQALRDKRANETAVDEGPDAKKAKDEEVEKDGDVETTE